VRSPDHESCPTLIESLPIFAEWKRESYDRLGCEAAVDRHDEVDQAEARLCRSFDDFVFSFSCARTSSSTVALLATAYADPRASLCAPTELGISDAQL
jgi:hypothetical protein